MSFTSAASIALSLSNTLSRKTFHCLLSHIQAGRYGVVTSNLWPFGYLSDNKVTGYTLAGYLEIWQESALDIRIIHSLYIFPIRLC